MNLKPGTKGQFGVKLDDVNLTGYPGTVDRIGLDGVAIVRLHTYGTPQHDPDNIQAFTEVPVAVFTTADKPALGAFWPDPPPALTLVPEPEPIPAQPSIPMTPRTAGPINIGAFSANAPQKPPTQEAPRIAPAQVAPPSEPAPPQRTKIDALTEACMAILRNQKALHESNQISQRMLVALVDGQKKIQAGLDQAAIDRTKKPDLAELMAELGPLGAMFGGKSPFVANPSLDTAADTSSPATQAHLIDQAVGGRIDPGPVEPEIESRVAAMPDVLPPEDEPMDAAVDPDVIEKSNPELDDFPASDAIVNTPDMPGPWRRLLTIHEKDRKMIALEGRQYPADNSWDLRRADTKVRGEHHMPDLNFQNMWMVDPTDPGSPT
jgi:hypothetical protein